STIGARAVGVPGTVAGLALALKRHGTMKWADLVEPARKLAQHGFPTNYQTVLGMRASTDLLSRFPDSKRIFLADGTAYQVGDRLVQPELAATLDRIARKGAHEFYDGETARRIVREMEASGGILTAADLKEYEPTVRKPLIGRYRDYEIITMPPPSSGGAAVLEMLNMLERYPLAKMGHNSADHLHLLVEVMRRAFADRAALMGDTDFVKVPVSGLVARKYADTLVASIDPRHATPSEKIRAGEPARFESLETTHYTIVDKDGTLVSNTYTLNGGYGAGLTARGTGVLLNNEMDDFTSKPGVPNAYGLIQGEANAIAPRKRPLSAMTPTIVLK